MSSRAAAHRRPETYQTLTLLDGFNVTQPATGQLLMRVSPIRSVR